MRCTIDNKTCLCGARVERPTTAASLRRSNHCYATKHSSGTGEDLSRRDLGIRILKGIVASSLPVGLGVAVESAVAPAGVEGAITEMTRSSTEDIAAAKGFLAAADSAFATGKYQEAVDAYSAVLETAPTQYTLCMKSLLGRREALAKLGQSDAAGRDNRREFAWGRGLRWPGWYIIGLIMFRNEIARD